MRASLLAAAATTALVLSACGSEAPQVVAPDAPAETAEEQTSESTPTAEVEEASDEEETDAETEADPEDEAEDQEAPEDNSGELGLGDSAQIGDYRVSVVEVVLDANDIVEQTDEFNDAPDGQFALALLSVIYTGEGEADPWLDLTIELAGSDARIYDASDCWAITPNSAMDVPTLTTGGRADSDVCFDAPPEALEDPRIRVEELFSFADTRVIWDPAREGTEVDPLWDNPPTAPVRADGLPLGTEAEVGDYTVAVTDVLLDANDAVQQANEFNDDPEGQYVLVSLAVTYIGADEGDPWLDLDVELAGSDARIYSSGTCWASIANSAMDVPTLTTGGQAEFDICFDVPVEALDAPQIRVEDFLSFDSDSRTVWESQ